MNKCALKNMKKTEITFFPTQYNVYFPEKLYNWTIFCIYFLDKVRCIRQNLFDIYSNALEIYFRAKKLYMLHIYFIFMEGYVKYFQSFEHGKKFWVDMSTAKKYHISTSLPNHILFFIKANVYFLIRFKNCQKPIIHVIIIEQKSPPPPNHSSAPWQMVIFSNITHSLNITWHGAALHVL